MFASVSIDWINRGDHDLQLGRYGACPCRGDECVDRGVDVRQCGRHRRVLRRPQRRWDEIVQLIAQMKIVRGAAGLDRSCGILDCAGGHEAVTENDDGGLHRFHRIQLSV